MFPVCPSEVDERMKWWLFTWLSTHRETLYFGKTCHTRYFIVIHFIPTIQESILSCCWSPLFSILTIASTPGLPRSLNELLWKTRLIPRSAQRWWKKRAPAIIPNECTLRHQSTEGQSIHTQTEFHTNAAVCFLLTLEGSYFFSLCFNFSCIK